MKRIKVSKEKLEQNNLTILMIVKPEELDEVLVGKTNSIKLSSDSWHEQSKRDEITAGKNPYTEHTTAMNKGTFANGINFWNIGKKLIELLSKDKEAKKESPSEVEFATLAKNTCDQKYFAETLKLKPEEIDLFLQFCDSDPKSKKVKENTNILSMMDFLAIKNKEFQKLKEDTK
ncbi:MAG: hypothetical protein ABI554_13605 [Flavobacterium sp.]